MSNSEKTKMAGFGLKQVRRVVIFVLGMSVVLFGVALLVLPGPAVVVIPAGLAILGIEFRWARNWLRRAKALVKGAGTQMRRGRTPLRLWREWRARRAQRKAFLAANRARAKADLPLPPIASPPQSNASREPVNR